MTGFSGGCLCGAIRYEVTGEPVRTAICHCNNCRRTTGSAFATNIFVHDGDLKIVKGAPKRFQHTTDSGATMTKEFCGDCGSPLFGYSSRGGGLKNVKVGSIDDARFVKPQIEVYTIRKLPYVHLLDETEHYEMNRPR